MQNGGLLNSYRKSLCRKYKGERMAEKNQNMNQSKNRAEEHDESVLNPEIKNESDLSKKEDV